MMNKYCMGVVVYNPTISELENIQTYADSGLFERIIIYDNSPQRISFSFQNDKCLYVFQNNNTGLAIPYNEMIRIAGKEDFDYLCIMDQDSSYKSAEINKMQCAINEYGDPTNVAAFCPIVLKKGFEDYVRTKGWIKADWCINSGTFLNLRFLQSQSITYDENVFLDGLDYDFCWTVKAHGGFIMQYCDSLLVQEFGYRTSEKQSFTYHAPFRYYLIAHNRKYIFKKHFGPIIGLLYAQIKNVVLSIKILIYEENKLDKFKACFKGIIQ